MLSTRLRADRRFSRSMLFSIAFAGAHMLALPAHAQHNGDRQRLRIDADWRFKLIPMAILEKQTSLTDWSWTPASPGETGDAALPDESNHAWRPATLGQDVFDQKPGYAWYRAKLPALAGTLRSLHFRGVDDKAIVYLNGKRMMSHEGWDQPFDVPLDSAWNPAGENNLLVLVQNTGGQGFIWKDVFLGLYRAPQAIGDPSQPGYDDSAWRPVHLPHDYVLEGQVTPTADNGHANLVPVKSWYRKTFTLPVADKGKSVWIDFDGVYRDAKVYLNGQLVGEHPCGYTSFRYDISQAAHYGGKNVLAVLVDPTQFEGWWYEGGGIYRHVWLNVANRLHVAPWGTFVTATLPEPIPGREPAPATVTMRTTLSSASPAVRATLVSTILDEAGRVVAKSTDPIRARSVTQRLTITRPRLWSPDTPTLYTAHSAVVLGDKAVDTVDTSFGVRTIRFDANHGFFLNGRPLKIKGTCNHQDFAGVGNAVPDRLEYWRVKKLKAMGGNAWRMSHNSPNPELLDACDKLGMLVMDENRHLGDVETTKATSGTTASDFTNLDSMILRDRNHPSVILWSLCNEEWVQGSADGARLFSALKRETQRLDTTRPIMCGMNGGFGAGISNVEDIQGFNYNTEEYDKFHAAYPKQPCIASESASTNTTRGVYSVEREKGYASAYDKNVGISIATAEDAWRPIAEREYMAGAFVWTGFDYKGEPQPFGWPAINSNFGIMDLCGFPKDNYYYYQSVWGNRPMAHLLPHWTWPGKEGQPIDVWAFSTGARVELFLNGKSLGVKDTPFVGHVSWSVPYTPGTLTAKAYDKAGKLIAADTEVTAGAPAALRLSADDTTVLADGEDVLPVAVTVVDAHGHFTPTASNPVTFSVAGPGRIVGVGNGDPSDHSPDKATQRRAFNGHCLVDVSARGPGKIVVTASAPGLTPATFVVRAAAQ
ncbi:beta-galactosidase [Capsulimonas corticalis]|uniref:Beta-galactosidase n=1 Tax=Capsulimonas corticalis TaxID=2219043 RepID=A0A402CWR3_9BACT|nr:beta-galactosidase GalA [Capsulimonas corticalis]BDI34237.1 beta-galactosidase [Capsulimonas corticalis]